MFCVFYYLYPVFLKFFENVNLLFSKFTMSLRIASAFYKTHFSDLSIERILHAFLFFKYIKQFCKTILNMPFHDNQFRLELVMPTHWGGGASHTTCVRILGRVCGCLFVKQVHWTWSIRNLVWNSTDMSNMIFYDVIDTTSL